MNQILTTPKKIYIKYSYIITFIVSIVIVVISCFYVFFLKYAQNKQSEISDTISKSYSISNLYADTVIVNGNYETAEPYIMGIIEIPKLAIKLPVISEMNDELLKISVCRFYGPKVITIR